MTKHQFIFSNERQHRIARHLSFWMLWSVAHYLLFHVPFYTFTGWSFDPAYNPGVFKNIEKIGLPLFMLKGFIFNSLLSVVVPQAIFIYILMNWVLPNFFYRKRNPVVVTGILIVSLFIYWFAIVQFTWFNVLGNYIFGILDKKDLTGWFYPTLISSLRRYLESLPVVAGFAIMIKLAKRWWIQQQLAKQIEREKNKAELLLLKAQIHPHFLFNTLNNIYFLTLKNSAHAPLMIKKLSDMLRYILNECNQPLVPLNKEILMIEDYIALEEMRYGEQMSLTVDIGENHSGKMIAPLMLIPFVENSFKHGASKMLTHSYVELCITTENNMLHFLILNSRPKIQETAKTGLSKKQGQIGLKNVRKRLELLYPNAHQLNIVSKPESFIVDLKIELQEMSATNKENNKPEQTSAYAMV